MVLYAFASALALAFDLANFIAKYLKKDFKRIFKTFIETGSCTLVFKLLVFPHWPCKKPLKAHFSELYYDKIYLEYFTSCLEYKNYFAIARAKKYNLISFFPILFQQLPLF